MRSLGTADCQVMSFGATNLWTMNWCSMKNDHKGEPEYAGQQDKEISCAALRQGVFENKEMRRFFVRYVSLQGKSAEMIGGF